VVFTRILELEFRLSPNSLQFILSYLVKCNHLSHLFIFFLSPLKCFFALSELITIRSRIWEGTWEKKLERIQIALTPPISSSRKYNSYVSFIQNWRPLPTVSIVLALMHCWTFPLADLNPSTSPKFFLLQSYLKRNVIPSQTLS
jgi:hypothetical protein